MRSMLLAALIPALFSALGRNPGDATAIRERAVSVTAARGWSMVGFPLLDHGRGIVLEVHGRIEIDRAEIVFDDGELKGVELDRRHAYGSGLYSLADFGHDRAVALVRLETRSRSTRSSVRALLTRTAG